MSLGETMTEYPKSDLMKFRFGIALPVILTAAILSSLVFLYFKYKQPETIHPIRTTAVMSVYATGTVDPVYEADISATLAGRVSKIYIEEGDEIEMGQILVQLDDTLEKSRIDEFQAAKTYLENEVVRLRSLHAKSYVSRKEFEKAAADLLEVTARLNTQLELIEKMKIRSPLDGTVLKRDIEIGEYVPTGHVIISVGKLSPLRVTADVDEEEISLVRIGQVTLMKSDAFTEVTEGKVYEITPKGDPNQKNFRARISLPKNTKFLIGMTVDVNIVIKKEENALMIPKEALVNDIVLVKQGFKTRERKVQVGIVGDEMVQILKGIDDDDNVILNPREYLKVK